MTIWKPTKDFAEEMGKAVKYNLRVEPKKGLVITLCDIRKMEVDFVYDSGVEFMGDRVVSFRYTSEIPMSYLDYPKENVRNQFGLILFKALDSDYIDRFKPFFPDDLAHRLEHHIYPVDTGIIEVICDYEPRVVLNKDTR
ncbi:hypothetical protein [Sporosarcina highlanderae]|uniref:Uncharacterized protein n=1 Tax=Sporosarcina highlanderae TaxID=3035916 RepID=A0ABT8JPI1_9BACL|nr:hypothetical protein [Sporosarcina highlanderae]MDN4607046.1 hypothetical protein [Sporosarcina highlanderae]